MRAVPSRFVPFAIAAASVAAAAAGCELGSRSFSVVSTAAPRLVAMELPPPGAKEPLDPSMNTEAYDRIDENPLTAVAQHPLSTFAIDVDTASYANVRRFVAEGHRPPKDAVRIEELLNYFRYDDPAPRGADPVAAHVETAACPWDETRRLVRIGLHAREIDERERPPANLVFLIDVSGSMSPDNKLPLLKRALALLAERLGPRDRVAMVVYAAASGVELPPSSVRAAAVAALDRLEAGGSTNGADGIQLAYRVAESGRVPGGINRVILATDGDFNVGVTNQGDLTRLIEEKAKSGVFLTVLGFGMGNYKDSTLEKLADRGNGNYAYIDTLGEARKVLVEQMMGTLLTVAKDVKVQVEWNPARVSAYRLLGYENRMLRAEDFNDDRKDAGEMGAGHSVTALYEIVPAGAKLDLPPVDPLKYQRAAASAAASGDVFTLKIRYQDPAGGPSRLIETAVADASARLAAASPDLRFAAAVAMFGMLLRDSPHKGRADWPSVLALASSSLGRDPGGHRAEFVRLASRAQALR